MALRPRLSTGLPLSDEQMIRFKQNEPDGYQAREGFRSSHLRQPGNPDPSGGMVDPMALRPRLSTGLLFSEFA